MAPYISQIDENVEIELLLNFSINKVSDLPDGIWGILKGYYESTINNELFIFIEAIKNNDSLEEIIHNSLSHAHLSWLCAGVASLLYFVQCNWTGPYIDKDIDWLKTRRNEALKHLSLHNRGNINVRKPELLYLSKKIFSNMDLQLKYRSCIWWLFRATLLHQHVLYEDSEILFEEIENLIMEINNLNILQNSLCKLLLNLEAAMFYLYYRKIQNSEKLFEHAQTIAGLRLSLESAMRKHIKNQPEEKVRLYHQIEMIFFFQEKDIFPSIDCEDVPKFLNLNDELRLKRIEFSGHKEETKLGMVEEAIILAKYVQFQLCQPKHKFTDEEIRPYLTKIIESTKNWSLKMTSLCHRCSLKCDERTIKRSMKQTKSLLKYYNDVRASIARRMDLFFASGMKPIWTLEENLANIILQYKTNNNNNIKEAKEIFKKLGLWENVIVCYNLLGWKAPEIFNDAEASGHF